MVGNALLDGFSDVSVATFLLALIAVVCTVVAVNMTSHARYKGPRVSNPRTVDRYCAITETFQYTFTNPDPVSPAVFVVEPGANMNEIKPFEPGFFANSFINPGSPLIYAMYTRFNEFRIRNVEVRVTSSMVNPVNIPRSDVWIWWCPNHYNEDEDAKIPDVYDDVTSLEEASRVQHVTVNPGRSFSLKCVPQLVMDRTSRTYAGTELNNFGDQPCPWLKTIPDNISQLFFRMPVIYFRRPYGPAGTPALALAQHYSVHLTAIFEFRDLDDDN